MTAHNSAIHALLWSEGSKPGTRISNDLMLRIGRAWDVFRSAAEDLGFDAERDRATAINPTEGDEWDYAAHDFILTANHHGAGFWDGNWHAPWGDRLTELAQTFGPFETYFDDTDTLHLYLDN